MSEPKISSTRLSTWLDCKRKWYLSEVEGHGIPSSEAMDFGSLFHALVEYRLEWGVWPPISEIERMDGNYEDPIEIVYRRGDEFYEWALRRAKTAWEWAPDDLLDQADPEVPVENFGFEMSGFILSGWFDLLAKSAQTIGDWKTRSGWSYSNAPRTQKDFLGDVQLCYYAAVAAKAYEWNEVTVVHLNVHREQPDKHFKAEATIPEWYLDEVWEKLEDEIAPYMADAWESKSDATKNPSACFKYGGCDFWGSQCDGKVDDDAKNDSTGWHGVLEDMNPNPPDAPDDEQPVPFPKKDISKLNVNVRAERNLREAGFQTLGDIDGVPEPALVEVPYVGEKTAETIIETLEKFRP